MKTILSDFWYKVIPVLLGLSLLVSSCYDDTEIRKQLEEYNAEIEKLVSMTSLMNDDIASLQAMLSALADSDFVTSITPKMNGEEIIGYTLTFAKGLSVTIYNSAYGEVPAIGVKQDTDGVWYWTIDGGWLYDENGDKVKAVGRDGIDGKDGVTPQLKIEDGHWFVSLDGGKTWEKETIGDASGDLSSALFQEVTYDDEYVYITMGDGELLVIPRAAVVPEGIKVSLSLDAVKMTSVSFSGHLDVAASDIPYSRVVLYYAVAEDFNIHRAKTCIVTSFDAMQNFYIEIDGLEPDTAYSYCLFAESKSAQYYGDIAGFQTLPIVNKRLACLANSVADYDEPLSGRTFSYNTEGRLIEVTEFGDWGTFRTELFYDGANKVDIFEEGDLKRKWVLNDCGYIILQEKGNSIYEYEYDEDGHLVKVYESYSGNPREVISNITWEDGNMTSWSKEQELWNDELGEYVARIKRQTYLPELNVSGIFPAYPERGALSKWMFETGFFGKPSLLLVATDKWDDLTSWAQFVYEYHPVTGDVFAAYKYYDGELDKERFYIWE